MLLLVLSCELPPQPEPDQPSQKLRRVLESLSESERESALEALCSGRASSLAAASAEPSERSGLTARRGSPLTLLGPALQVGQMAPPFALRAPDGSELRSEALVGKLLVISVVPSLDTPVCESQTGWLARAFERLPEGSVLLTVSRDLPFAQRRFAELKGYPGLYGSDHPEGEFGRDYGVLVKESGLLARSVWVVGQDGRLLYLELVSEQSQEPNYEALFAAIPGAHAAQPEAPGRGVQLAVQCALDLGYRSEGFPAVAEDGVVAQVFRAADGARGAPNLVLGLWTSQGGLLGQVTLWHPEEELVCDTQKALFEERAALANAMLAGRKWQPMQPLDTLAAASDGLPEQPDATQVAVLGSAAHLQLRFAEPWLVLSSSERRFSGVISTAEWAAPVRWADCAGQNPARLVRAWTDDQRVLLVELGYGGSDRCWEPDSRFLVLNLPVPREPWNACAELGGSCAAECERGLFFDADGGLPQMLGGAVRPEDNATLCGSGARCCLREADVLDEGE